MSRLAGTRGLGAFAFQTGTWRVTHQKLRTRLESSADWVEFGGTCAAWEIMDGAGNVDDHYLDDPTGAYRAATFRRLDPIAGLWSIWWLDPRFPALEPPVHGRFDHGIGSFFADDTLAGRPVKVRFLWSDIEADRARWEQAFSADGGANWETNWIMNFERMG